MPIPVGCVAEGGDWPRWRQAPPAKGCGRHPSAGVVTVGAPPRSNLNRLGNVCEGRSGGDAQLDPARDSAAGRNHFQLRWALAGEKWSADNGSGTRDFESGCSNGVPNDLSPFAALRSQQSANLATPQPTAALARTTPGVRPHWPHTRLYLRY